MAPAALSLLAVGGAAAARGVVEGLLPWLFAGSMGLLFYAHYLTWIRRHKHPISLWVLIFSTALVVMLWYSRVRLWVGLWLA